MARLDIMSKKNVADSLSTNKEKIDWRKKDLDAINAGAKYGITYGMNEKERDSVSKKNRPNWLNHLKKMDVKVAEKTK